MEFVAYPDRELLAMGLADRLASSLRNCLTVHETASFCVPGGSSPGEAFSILSGNALEWARVRVFLGDERWVPTDHERSNTRLLRETLLTGPAAAATLIPMVTDAPTPEEGIPSLEAGFEGAFPISVLLLGMGADMHTASLLPDSPDLGAALASDAPILVPVRARSQPEPRVTLSARILRDAMETHVLIMGQEKRDVLEGAVGRDPAQAPIAAFLRDATVHWAP